MLCLIAMSHHEVPVRMNAFVDQGTADKKFHPSPHRPASDRATTPELSEALI